MEETPARRLALLPETISQSEMVTVSLTPTVRATDNVDYYKSTLPLCALVDMIEHLKTTATDDTSIRILENLRSLDMGNVDPLPSLLLSKGL